MGSLHLLVLYVTVKQEEAVRSVYKKHKWDLENKAEQFFYAVKHSQASAEQAEGPGIGAIKIGKVSDSIEVYHVYGTGDIKDSLREKVSDNKVKPQSQKKHSNVSSNLKHNEISSKKAKKQLQSRVPKRSKDEIAKQLKTKSKDAGKHSDFPSDLTHNEKCSQKATKHLRLRDSKRSKDEIAEQLKTKSSVARNVDSENEVTVDIEEDIPVAKVSVSKEVEQDTKRNVQRDEKTTKVCEKTTKVRGKRKTSKLREKVVGKKVYKCLQCSYSCTISSNYLRHVRTAHVSVRHNCTHCHKTFKSKHEAKSHELHAHLKTVKCEKCDKTFTSRGGLLNHTKQVHLKKALYSCEVCQATFYYKQHFQGHMNKHNAERPFSCSKCGKGFSYKASLNVHERGCDKIKQPKAQVQDEIQEMPKHQKVLCDICGEALSNKSSLKTHNKFVHSEAPRSECTICGRQFKGKYSLLRHHKIKHTEEKDTSLPCEICGKTFNQVTILRQHVKRHKQEYSVYCETCGKGFYHNFKMKEHARMHTGEKPFSCSVCHTFKCSSKTNLIKHMKLHSSGKKVRDRKPQSSVQNVVIPAPAPATENQSSLPLTDGVTSMAILELVPVGPMYKNTGSYANEDLHNGELITHDAANNHNNVTAMTMTNEMIRYNHGQYGEESVIPVQDGGYDPGMHADGYYDNTNMSTPSNSMSQGLNILTVAMNIVNPGSY